MKFRLAGVLSSAFSGFIDAQEQAPLKLVVPSLAELKDGDFDHFTVDLDGHRLFLNQKKMEKFWCSTRH